MTDSSMNFGPAWIRNLRSEGTTSGGGTSGTRYQLAEYRYGREEMLALFDKYVKPPPSLLPFKTLYSEQTLTPLALLPATDEEQRGGWQSRPTTLSGSSRGRGSSLERGGPGRVSRGRGGYPPYGRATSAYDSGWGNGEQPDWSPRKEFATRSAMVDNWRRVRGEEDEGWRNLSSARSLHEKWTRSTSWRGEGDSEERNGPPERGGRSNWQEASRGGPLRRSWDNEDHLPEWATENPTEGGGTFDERGAFHGSDDEQDYKDSRREALQKSASHQHIPSGANQARLASSKSTTSLIKSDTSDRHKEKPGDQEFNAAPKDPVEKNKPKLDPSLRVDKLEDIRNDRKEDFKVKSSDKLPNSNGPSQEATASQIDKVEEDFDRLQEDLVLKLVVDEETPKPTPQLSSAFEVQPPPNLAPPSSQEKWYYQDPQGTRQGPFANVEMAEWYKAGYFSNSLHVMRDCDERYFLLGELISLCGGENPFLSNIRFPVLKNEVKLSDEMLSYQFLSQLAFNQQISMRNLAEPWSALTLQQQEMAAQRLLLQQQQQQQQPLPHDLQFIQQTTPNNPLMYMINQMQQSNKLPGSVLVDKPTSAVPTQLDPLLVQMGNMHSLQNRMQPAGLHNHLPNNPDGLGNSLPGLQTPTIANLPGMHGALPAPVNRPAHNSMDQMASSPDNDPIAKFLKQFQQQRQNQLPLETLWQKPNQFNAAPPVSAPSQWPQQSETPISMWDLQTNEVASPTPTDKEKEKEQRQKEEISQKELKKRKEQEEKLAKKEAEERRKQEQKKQEVEKKAAEEKKRKEEERVKKELEKAKKEAEEKRLRELEEKRRLKEQRKAEEEARKKADEQKKQEDEKNKREAREREEKKQAEAARLAQNQGKNLAKSAPWSQPNFPQGLNLTDIQKAEKEKRAQETAIQIQKQQLQEQQQLEKQSSIQLNWAKKPVEPRKVKSFAEIQAEEQEKMSKLTAEARLTAQMKEKEAPASAVSAASIWNGQSLTWANASSNSQWSSSNAVGFWDEVPTKSSTKPSTVSKSNSTSAMATKQQQQQKQSKNKSKKEDSQKAVNNNNNQTKDDFTEWCYKTLSNISSDVDIPTFVTFLRDIESAYDVREYCKEYLGESPATQQFASNFLEKRRSFRPRNNAHKDDMCSPAPAITPSAQYSAEFQEVKGKNKKNKKFKMSRIDSRILGFNVTSATDRINVGDRDYGDNS